MKVWIKYLPRWEGGATNISIHNDKPQEEFPYEIIQYDTNSEDVISI